jgi:hypothetical protein
MSVKMFNYVGGRCPHLPLNQQSEAFVRNVKKAVRKNIFFMTKEELDKKTEIISGVSPKDFN